MISTNEFRNGSHIDVEGTIFKIVEFQHVKPGKGGAFVRTKLRRATDGNVIDRTFRAGEKFRPVRTEVRNMQFLYKDGTDAHFMDTETYEQLTIPETTLADPLRWMKESDEVEVSTSMTTPPTCSFPALSTLRSPRPSLGCAATPRQAAAPSPPRSRRARRSLFRCSSTSATRCAWTLAPAIMCHVPRNLPGMRAWPHAVVDAEGSRNGTASARS